MSANENENCAIEGTGAALYPIRTVANVTGVNPVTLRAWERRYGLIKPHRTPKGHRLYTQDDIDLINDVVELLNTGIPISQVRQRLEAPARREPEAEPGAGEPLTDAWEHFRRRMIQAVVHFDEQTLNAAYNEALSLYPVDLVTERLITPVLRLLGERWEGRAGGVAEEHFFGTYLRNKLGARLHHLSNERSPVRLLAACLPGEQHELGLLLFCLAAAGHGYGFINLGANTPLEELPPVLERVPCDAILLSGSVAPEPEVLERELPRLVTRAGVPVLVGGQTAVTHSDAIKRAGAVALGADTTAALRRLAGLLGTPGNESVHPS